MIFFLTEKTVRPPVPGFLFNRFGQSRPISEICFGSTLSRVSVPESLLTLSTFFQESTGTRSDLFKQLANQYHKLQKSFDALVLKMNSKEEEQKRALSEEKSEVARIQRELDRVEKVKNKVKGARDALRRERDTLQKEKDTIQKERDTLHAGLQRRAEMDKQIQTTVAESEAELKAAKEELAAHQAASAKWLAQLASLNDDMDRKFTESPFFFLLLTDTYACVPSC